MGLSDFININRDIKFSPTLVPVVNGEVVRVHHKKNTKLFGSFKGGLLTILNRDNAVSGAILESRRAVEAAFGTKNFDSVYAHYSLLLSSLFSFCVGYLNCDPSRAQSYNTDIKDYVAGPLYRRLPYSVKSNLIHQINDPLTPSQIALGIIKLPETDYNIFESYGKLLISSSKIVSLPMQKYIKDIQDALSKVMTPNASKIRTTN